MKCSNLSQLYNKLGLSMGNGLVKVKGKPDWYKNTPDGIFFSSRVIEQLNILKPETFYHFGNIPMILFFEGSGDAANMRRIHSQSWCFNQAPIIFILEKNTITAYNAFRFKNRELQRFNFKTEEIEKHFCFWELQSGNTWKWIEENFYRGEIKKDRVDRYLLRNIRTAVMRLEGLQLSVKTATNIILKLIFSRYLIDRGVIIDEKFIEGSPAEKEKRKENFNRLIKNKARLFQFFDYLKARFNGNLFEDEPGEADIDKPHLDLLPGLLKGDDLDTGDQVLFNTYDFSIIPIELISGIYESIIDEKKRKTNASIYTPPFLVNYILKHTVENYLEKKDVKNCKVLDPSCGSGIFLVESYRKMVEKERAIKGITYDKLVELLENNIYGIDKDEVALNVAIFSLYVALLDYISPKDIRQIKLPELLRRNLFPADFFDTEHSFNNILKKQGLTFILGNPPWKSDTSEKHLEYIDKNQLKVAGFEISQTFLLRTKDFHNKSLKCAMIVSSKSFYNIWSKEFKKYFFRNFYIDHFFDLSPSRRLIFEDAKKSAAIIFYRYASGEATWENVVKHTSVKPNLFLKNFNALTIEKYDQNEVMQKLIIEHDWILKTLLYGGRFDYHFIKRLKEVPGVNGVKERQTVENHLKSLNKDKPEIFWGDGIKKYTPNAIKKLSPQQRKSLKAFEEIANIPIIDMNSIKKYYSSPFPGNLPKPGDLMVKSGRREELYKNDNAILIKARPENESELVVSYVDTPCVFREKTLGISTKHRTNELKYIYGILNSDLSTYFQFLTSSSWGIFIPEIAQQEYLSFPYAANTSMKKKIIELVDHLIAQYKTHYSREIRTQAPLFPIEPFKRINEMINKTYEVNDIEKDLIDYVLQVTRYLFQESKAYNISLRRVSDKELRNYARVFYDHFSHVYNSEEEYFQVEYFYLGYFIAMKFKIVPNKPEKGMEIVKSQEREPETVLFKVLAQKLSIYKITEELYINKVLRGFDANFFYIIKPNELKSWHRAIAHMDLAEFIDTINKAERKEIMNRSD